MPVVTIDLPKVTVEVVTLNGVPMNRVTITTSGDLKEIRWDLLPISLAVQQLSGAGGTAGVPGSSDATALLQSAGNTLLTAIRDAQATEVTLAALNAKNPALIAGRVPVDGSGITQPVSGNVSVFTDALPIDLPLVTVAATAYTDRQVMAWDPAGVTVRGSVSVAFAWWLDHLTFLSRFAGTFRVIVFHAPPVGSTITVGTIPAIPNTDHGKIAAILEYGAGVAFDDTASFYLVQNGGSVTLPKLIRFPDASTKLYFLVQSIGANTTTGNQDFQLTGSLALATTRV